VQGLGSSLSGTVGGLFGGLFGGQPSGPQYQPGMMGRGLPTPQAPSPLMPSPMLRAMPQVPQRTYSPSYANNRARQIAEGKASQLDEFGNIR
jgi:hypothetical protein